MTTDPLPASADVFEAGLRQRGRARPLETVVAACRELALRLSGAAG